jgi:hypothetical protein
MKPLTPLAVVVMIWLPGTQPSLAQEPACVTVVRGETAALAAKRITGDVRNRLAPWFQIVDPAGPRVVPKTDYDHIEPGWRACVALMSISDPVSRIRESGVLNSMSTFFADIFSVLVGHELAWLAWGALAVAGILIWLGIDEYLTQREATVAAMKRFGQTFVREFERPLIQPERSERPIHSQLRASPDRGRLEILLAPGGGSRYPNLSDHSTNVAYDVGRVLDVLQDRRFVCQPVYPQGSWVVVPFQFRVSTREADSK